MRPTLWERGSLWLPPIVYMAAIFHLSSEPAPLPQLTAHVWDKLLHTVEYSVLALLLCRAFLGEGTGWLVASVLAVLIASAYGASDEWHQYFVPLRSSDVKDWLADSAGAALGVLAYRVASGRRGERISTA